MPSVPVEQLNLIYNACDVGLNTATGEGWGLVAFEHAATGAAQVVPDHSACAELWNGSAVMLKPEVSFTNERTLTQALLVTPRAVADALERLYADRGYLRAMSLAAYKVATQPAYSWESIAERWDALWMRLLEQDNSGPEYAGL